MPTLRFGAFELDTQRFELRRGGSMVPLQRRAFDVLAYLMERRERVVGKDELAAEVWCGAHVGDASISVAVSIVRRALRDDPREPMWLATVYGRGYRFVGEAIDVSQAGSQRIAAGVQASHRGDRGATCRPWHEVRRCVVLGDLAARFASHEAAASHYRLALERLGVAARGEKPGPRLLDRERSSRGTQRSVSRRP
jgi:DNA-binding winged helix-turn-helix (wHTH) protein